MTEIPRPVKANPHQTLAPSCANADRLWVALLVWRAVLFFAHRGSQGAGGLAIVCAGGYG
jgi:hypothetical protein